MRPSRFILTALLLCVTGASAQEKNEAAAMTQEEFIAIKTGKTPEADAKKKWEGKTAEFTVTKRATYQELTSRLRMGQTLASFRIQSEGKVLFFGAYFKGERNRALLKTRKPEDTTPLKIRGKVMIDYQSSIRIWFEDADVVKE